MEASGGHDARGDRRGDRLSLHVSSRKNLLKNLTKFFGLQNRRPEQS